MIAGLATAKYRLVLGIVIAFLLALVLIMTVTFLVRINMYPNSLDIWSLQCKELEQDTARKKEISTLQSHVNIHSNGFNHSHCHEYCYRCWICQRGNFSIGYISSLQLCSQVRRSYLKLIEYRVLEFIASTILITNYFAAMRHWRNSSSESELANKDNRSPSPEASNLTGSVESK